MSNVIEGVNIPGALWSCVYPIISSALAVMHFKRVRGSVHRGWLPVISTRAGPLPTQGVRRMCRTTPDTRRYEDVMDHSRH